MRRMLLCCFLLCLLPATVLAEYRASKKSRIYHFKLCRWAAQIKPEYRIAFPTVAAARKAGYLACGKCRPPGIDPGEAGKTPRKNRGVL